TALSPRGPSSPNRSPIMPSPSALRRGSCATATAGPQLWHSPHSNTTRNAFSCVLFNSYTFLAFLAVVLPLYYALPHRWQNRMLLVARYIFYAAWDWRFLGLLLIQTVVDYFAALRMGEDRPQARRRLYLLLSLGVNLGILGFFKYFNFFIDSFGQLL